MMSVEVEGGTPWYRNFWPWFIVVLLGVSVFGSLATVAIAVWHADVDVRRVVAEPTGEAEARSTGG